MSMFNSVVLSVMLYFNPEVSALRYLSGRETGRDLGAGSEPPPEDEPLLPGAGTMATFTSPGRTSVMLNFPSAWIGAAEYELPSVPTNWSIPESTGCPLYVTVPLTVIFLTPLLQPTT